jgi:hypothetical protein
VTAIVGIRCKDGVVVGADSSATFGDGGGNRVIEQSTRKKIEIIGDSVIVAGTGSVGHMQRFTAVIEKLWDTKSFSGKSEIEIGKLLSSAGIADFHQTHAMNRLEFAAMVRIPLTISHRFVSCLADKAYSSPKLRKLMTSGSRQLVAGSRSPIHSWHCSERSIGAMKRPPFKVASSRLYGRFSTPAR